MKILMIGGYGYNDVGDEAQPHAILDNIRKEIKKDIDIVMLSPNPSFTEKYHGVMSEQDIRIVRRVINKKETSQNDEYFQDYRYILCYAWLKKRGKLISIRDDIIKIVERIQWADVIINSGGGNINSIMFKELLKRTAIHRIAKYYNKKVIVSNQTIGPFYSERDEKIAKKALSNVDLLTFRDKEISRKRCIKIGVTNNNMYDAADDAISLFGVDKEKAIKLINDDVGEKWLKLTAKVTVGVNIKGSLNTFKGKGRNSSLDSEISKIILLSEYLIRKHSSKIILISTDYCSGVDDRVYLREIKNGISSDISDKVAILEKEYTDYELKGIIGCLDIAIGVRYHFIVFAAANKVPFLGIASGEYQKTKLEGIANLAGLPICYLKDDLEYAGIDTIYRAIDNVIDNRLFIYNKLVNIIPVLIENSKKPIYEINKYLSNYK